MSNNNQMEHILTTTIPQDLAIAAGSLNSASGNSKKKLGATKISHNLFRSKSPAMDFALEDENNTSKIANEILEEQDLIDLASARENPKLASMVKNIDVLVEKTQKARKDLELMMQTSVDLKNQCKLQEEECQVLEQEQHKVNGDMLEMRKKVETLGNEKAILEAKLAQLRRENDDLEAFLAQADPSNPEVATNPTPVPQAS